MQEIIENNLETRINKYCSEGERVRIERVDKYSSIAILEKSVPFLIFLKRWRAQSALTFVSFSKVNAWFIYKSLKVKQDVDVA